MKKFVIAFILLAAPLVLAAGEKERTVPRQRLLNVIKEYRGDKGFEVVNIGGLGLSALKTAARVSMASEAADDPDSAAEIDVMNDVMRGIRRIAVVDCEDAGPAVRRRFNDKVFSILDGCEVLMEAKEEGESVYIYGMMDEDGTTVRDFVVFSPDEGALVCLFGRISFEKAMQLAGE